MAEAESQHDPRTAAILSMVQDWDNLSRGDTAIITRCIRDSPDAMAMTLRGTAHARFWHGLVSVGWAEQLYTPQDPYEHDPEPLMFRLTPGSDKSLSYFLVHYDLLNRGACTPATDAQLRGDAENESKRASSKGSQSIIDAKLPLLVFGLVVLLLIRDAIFG